MHDGSTDHGWATLAEAATLLGVSVYTVRRRMKRGELHAKQVLTRHGLAWHVRLSDLPGVAPAGGDELRQDAQGPAMVELIRVVERLQEENRNLAGQVGYYQAKLQDAEHRLLALEAPVDRPESPPDARETASPGGVALEPSRAPSAPWWRRLHAADAGARLRQQPLLTRRERLLEHDRPEHRPDVVLEE
jgi:hypothetical protein